MENELPRYIGPADHLRAGFRSHENEFCSSHPVAEIQRNEYDVNWSNKIEIVRRIHGSGFAMRLATERLILCNKSRLPGLKSSSVLLETACGTDTTIDFEDFLNGKVTL
jgi:hypothetical protein